MKKIRAYKFKKKLIDESLLPQEAEVLSPIFQKIWQDYESKILEASDVALLFILHTLKHRHPKKWWGAKLSQPHRNSFSFALSHPTFESQFSNLWDIVLNRSLFSIPAQVNQSLLAWKMSEYPLVLFDSIPSVENVLRLQIKGKRCVSVFREKKFLSQLILGERDSLGFICHDLIHAHHFFHNNEMKMGQIGFYQQVYDCLLVDSLKKYFSHAEVSKELDYLVSDMNSHPVHLWKCFKSMILHWVPEAWPNLHFFLSQNDSELFEALRYLNDKNLQELPFLEPLSNRCYRRGNQFLKEFPAELYDNTHLN